MIRHYISIFKLAKSYGQQIKLPDVQQKLEEDFCMSIFDGLPIDEIFIHELIQEHTYRPFETWLFWTVYRMFRDC